MRHQLILIAAIATALGALPALAHQRDPSKAIHCPELARQARTDVLENRMLGLEGRIESLQSRLESLNTRLESFDLDRREALDEAKVSIESVVHDASLTQPEIDAAVDAALTRAQDRAKAVAASAGPALEEAKSVKGELGVLVQQLHTLARGEKQSSDRG